MSKQRVASIIRKAFAERQKKNPQYSLRSFARDLDVSPGRLSRIMNNKDEAGNRLISAILKAKIFTPEEHLELSQCMKEMENPFTGQYEYQGYDLDAKDVASVWHHLAVFNLLTIPGFVFDESVVAQRLGLALEDVQRSVEFLVRQKAIQKTPEGNYAAFSEQMYFSPKQFNEIYDAHLNYLVENKKRALEAGTDKSFFGLVTVTMSDEAFQKAKLLMNKTMAKICKEDQTSPNKKVFHVSAQMFSVDEGPGAELAVEPTSERAQESTI